tara:strand:+ start:7030 stop:7371 length:342 start_codon:yes stop_codon:yes gene_type:complete
MSDTDMQKQAEIDLMKEMVEEIRELRERVVSLESQNQMLTKSLDDPETMMRKAGWLKVVTPMADETYDPLQRDVGDGSQSFTGPFQGTGNTFQKSRYDQLEEWKEAEQQVMRQ